MQRTNLTELARQELANARASLGMSSTIVFGGARLRLRQTAMALLAGQRLPEHRNPGEATLQVVHGRVRLHSGTTSWNGSVGDLLIVPDGLHSLDAVEDSVVLLSVVANV